VLAQLSDTIRAAAAARQCLRLRGGGTKDFYGQSLEGEILDLRGHAGILDYDPGELVVSARCGTPLAELEAVLRGEGQMLAFEPPYFAAPGAALATAVPTAVPTFGGAIAAGLSGPRRQAAGALRDFVLGATLMNGAGEVLRFGGQVMKNVAGYDVSRLLAGSLGTLGVILEASLKTLPLPVAEASLRFELPEERAITTLNHWAARPLPISASAWSGGSLAIRLSGAAAAVSAACDRLGGERLADVEAAQFWRGLRDHSEPFFASCSAQQVPLWRLSVPSNTPPLALSGACLIEWGGALRWLASRADPRTVRGAVARAGGHATLFRGGDKLAGVFQPLAPALEKIHRNLKAEFDPQGVFNRGRMYPGW